MNDRIDPIADETLEAYLDGLLDDADRKALEEQLRTNPGAARQVQLQSQIDAALSRRFHVAGPPPSHVEAVAAGLQAAWETRSRDQRPSWYAAHGGWLAALAAAAAIGWVLIASYLPTHDRVEPFFAPTPVATIYRETIANGFRPYYDCREPERFAATFQRRQGQPLQLQPLPVGSAMLGLAYPGGLSRNTTAMLCRVDERPVMVFVDRLEVDRTTASQNDDPQLRVFRDERSGLVFYEVTPHDSARVIPFLSAAPAPADAP